MYEVACASTGSKEDVTRILAVVAVIILGPKALQVEFEADAEAWDQGGRSLV